MIFISIKDGNNPSHTLFYLFVRFFQVFHKDSHYNVDQNELGHENKHDKEERGDILIDTTIPQTFFAVIAFFSKRIFHDSIPIITWRNNKNVNEIFR